MPPPLNGNGTMRHGTPICSQICATGPRLLKPHTSTAACSCSNRCLARISACRSAPPSSRLNSTKTMRRPLRVELEAGVSGGSSFFAKRGTHFLQDPCSYASGTDCPACTYACSKSIMPISAIGAPATPNSIFNRFSAASMDSGEAL